MEAVNIQPFHVGLEIVRTFTGKSPGSQDRQSYQLAAGRLPVFLRKSFLMSLQGNKEDAMPLPGLGKAIAHNQGEPPPVIDGEDLFVSRIDLADVGQIG